MLTESNDLELIDLNSAGGIGANCQLLKIGDFHFVIDAGSHPKETGRNALPAFEKIAHLPIDLIFLTHTHLDHLGALPVLLKQHPNVPVVTSKDSHGLFKRLLHNSCNVMERQRVESGGVAAVLYTHADVSRSARRVMPAHPGVPRIFESMSGDRITFTLYSSGHIPGAVGILFEYHHRKIFVTGDVLFTDTAMLDGARFPKGDFDTIIIETTRGMTERPVDTDRTSEVARLISTIAETTRAGGSVLIPSFALGRLQELLVTLLHATHSGELAKLPIFISGLGLDLLNQFDTIGRHNEGLRIRRSILRHLDAQKLPEKHSFEKSGPAIYLLSSGMMVEHTPSWHAASRLLKSSRNSICFVGYCDPQTPGGELLNAAPGSIFNFPLLEKAVPVNASIQKFDLSSHADRNELLEFAVEHNPRAIVLTHGDQPARDWFAESFRQALPKAIVHDPKPLTWQTI